MRTCGCKNKDGSRCKRRGSIACWQHRGAQRLSLWQRIVRNQTLAFWMDVVRVTLAVFAFLGISGKSVPTLLHTDPPTTTVSSTFGELSKPNPLLQAMRQPPPILGVAHARTQIAESNSLLGTISAIGLQITEHSATDDFVTVTVQRVPTKKQIAITISPETG